MVPTGALDGLAEPFVELGGVAEPVGEIERTRGREGDGRRDKKRARGRGRPA